MKTRSASELTLLNRGSFDRRQNVHSSAESAAQCSKGIVHGASEKATEIVHSAVQKIIDWKACHFDMLPSWMRLVSEMFLG